MGRKPKVVFTHEGMDVINLSPSGLVYADLEYSWRGMKDPTLGDDQIVKLLVKIVKRVNIDRNRLGERPIKPITITWIRGRQYPSADWSNNLFLHKKSILSDILHEVAHISHSVHWNTKIKQTEANSNTFDCHGVRFMSNCTYVRGLVEKYKSIQNIIYG